MEPERSITITIRESLRVAVAEADTTVLDFPIIRIKYRGTVAVTLRAMVFVVPNVMVTVGVKLVTPQKPDEPV
jgi:hypothetical protein